MQPEVAQLVAVVVEVVAVLAAVVTANRQEVAGKCPEHERELCDRIQQYVVEVIVVIHSFLIDLRKLLKVTVCLIII